MYMLILHILSTLYTKIPWKLILFVSYDSNFLNLVLSYPDGKWYRLDSFGVRAISAVLSDPARL